MLALSSGTFVLRLPLELSDYGKTMIISNQGFALDPKVVDDVLSLRLIDCTTDNSWADGGYRWSIVCKHRDGLLHGTELREVEYQAEKDSLIISAVLAGFQLEHRWYLPSDQDWMEESLRITNANHHDVDIMGVECGFLRRVADTIGQLVSNVADERLTAIPFRKRPTDSEDWINEHPIDDFLRHAGREPRCNDALGFGFLPSRHWCSEAWAWSRGERTLSLMSFCQDHMLWSAISTVNQPNGLYLRYGGFYINDQDELPVFTLAAGESTELGLMRYQSVACGYEQAAYSYREFLDSKGCRFPMEFDPPVHWNVLYDNPDWWVISPRKMPKGSRVDTRKVLYTREHIEAEAIKARDYQCEAIYLDPGWDTTFGSFQWDSERLGAISNFVNQMRERYGLNVSLHAPLATWMSHEQWSVHPWNTMAYWPDESRRLPPKDEADGQSTNHIGICLGSRQYLDEAEKRLLLLCQAGIGFIMFDGNWWNGGCDDVGHGHPVPYTKEDHIRANLDLAQCIHTKFPDVLIEMHDMLCGGEHPRMTPVYYKYGLPNSYDSNWGFELMWDPFEELRSRRALALYYYNLACNVPIYLHIDLRDDNQHCTIFWWFASLCRHLGIGGTHADPNVVICQQHAMARYRELDALYKRGDFYGISEEIHVHVLPSENRLVVDLFNLTDTERRVTGTMSVETLGIDQQMYYQRTERWVSLGDGQLHASCLLPAWGHQQVELRPVPS